MLSPFLKTCAIFICVATLAACAGPFGQNEGTGDFGDNSEDGGGGGYSR